MSNLRRSYVVVVIINFLIMFSVSCQTDSYSFELQSIKTSMEKKHKIRRLNTFIKSEGHINGDASFFLIFGSANIDGKFESYKSVTFAWEDENGQYIISLFRVERIRIIIDDNIEIPTVFFEIKDISNFSNFWQKHTIGKFRNRDYQYLIDEYVIKYAIITVNPKDWPANVDALKDIP